MVMKEEDDGVNRAIDQPNAVRKPYQTPSLIRYGALKELTKGGSEPMHEGGGSGNQERRS